MCSACTKIEHGGFPAEEWAGKRVTLAFGQYGEIEFIDDLNGRYELIRDPITESYWIGPIG